MEETTGGWGKLHYEETHNFCSSENIISLIKWRLRQTELVACMIKMGSHNKFYLKSRKKEAI
jgi:hypothetical protein